MPIHIFIFTRDLALADNTTLIEMTKKYKNITPIFIFNPVQIDVKKNSYHSSNSVQFMIESLAELNTRCDITYFYGEPIKVLSSLHKQFTIASIGINYEYSPFGIQRLQNIIEFGEKNNIDVISREHYMLYDILNGQTLKPSDATPYQIFTPYFRHCTSNLKVREPDPYNKFNFVVPKGIKQNEYYYDFKNSKEFYIPNENISVRGGRKNGLKILKNIDKFKNYEKCRNILKYSTTKLSSYNHYSVVTIREVYHRIASVLGKKSGLITELHWRQFYYDLCYRFPYVLRGQISDKPNLAFKPEYNKIKWSYSTEKFMKWANALTGVPVIDSAMRQLNTSGFMHNRARMFCASYAVKNLHLDWRDCERYFAIKLVDYDAIVNNLSWQWASGSGPDSQPYFRIFNAWTQAEKFDPNCEYIKHWLPELKDVPNEDILKWYETYPKYEGIYPKPIVSHEETRKETIKMYKKALR